MRNMWLNRRWEKQQNDKLLEMCKLCGRRYKDLRAHLYREHLMNLKEYAKKKAIYKDNDNKAERRGGKMKEKDKGATERVKWTKIGNLWWSENLGKMNWYDAKEKCESLGGRLPTRIELLDLYDNHYDECKKLDDGFFWSATEVSDTTSYAWSVSLHNGYTCYYFKSNSYDVRCVRRAKGDK